MKVAIRLLVGLSLAMSASSCAICPPSRAQPPIRSGQDLFSRPEDSQLQQRVPINLADDDFGSAKTDMRGDEIERCPWLPLRLRLEDVLERPNDVFSLLPAFLIWKVEEGAREAPAAFPKEPDRGLFANPIK